MKKINLVCIMCGRKIKKRDLKFRPQGQHEGSMCCLKCEGRCMTVG